MANHKSAKKRAKQTIQKTFRNKTHKSISKTLIKKFHAAIEAKDKVTVSKLTVEVQSNVARLCKLGVIKKNTAARKTSRLVKQAQTVL